MQFFNHTMLFYWFLESCRFWSTSLLLIFQQHNVFRWCLLYWGYYTTFQSQLLLPAWNMCNVRTALWSAVLCFHRELPHLPADDRFFLYPSAMVRRGLCKGNIRCRNRFPCRFFRSFHGRVSGHCWKHIRRRFCFVFLLMN